MICYKCANCTESIETEDNLALAEETCPVCGHVNLVPKSRAQLKEERRFRKAAERAEKQRLKEEALAKRKAEEQLQAQRAEERRRLLQEAEEIERRKYQDALRTAKLNPGIAKVWCCSLEGKEWGPMPEARLQTWITEGKVQPEDWVRAEGMTTWVRASDLPEIFCFPAAKEDEVRCPKCGSTQLAANKKGMDAGGACCGAALLGPLGLLCGLSEADKVVITCIKCGHHWKVG